MGYRDLYEHLTVLSDRGCTRQSTDIRVALDSFPDLQVYTHGQHTMLLTKSVNEFVDLVFFDWDGDKLAVRPYIVDRGVTLHPIPAVYYVGCRNPNGFGIVPFKGWEELLAKHNIAPEINKLVTNHLNLHCPVSYGLD